MQKTTDEDLLTLAARARDEASRTEPHWTELAYDYHFELAGLRAAHDAGAKWVLRALLAEGPALLGAQHRAAIAEIAPLLRKALAAPE